MPQLQQENNFLLYNILYRHYFSDWQTRDSKTKLGLFLLGNCKAHCEYCYINKYHTSLYPKELENKNTILNNLQLVLNWYKENKFFCNIDIFSAEWITTEYFEPVFEIIYNSFKREKYKPKLICIPDNFQFIKDEQLVKRVQYWIDKIQQEEQIRIGFSVSIDGKYCDFGRSRFTDEEYRRLFEFCKKNHYGFHPMVSSTNIKYWIDNYKWWISQTSEITASSLMMLEVRDQTWTEQSIQNLLQFLDFEIDFFWNNIFHQNKKDLLNFILDLDRKELTEKYPQLDIPYNNIGLKSNGFVYGDDHFTCSFGHSIEIRLGDLTVAPCHRLWYEELLIGQFKIEDNKIIELEAKNINLAILKSRVKPSCLPHCETCNFIGTCINFCLGNSYEVCRNMLIPTKEVCNMYRSKLAFLIFKYHTLGLWDMLDDLDQTPYIIYIKQLCKNILGNLK